MPLREIFNSLFFVSIGMQLNAEIISEYPIIMLLSIIGVILLKMVVTSVVTFFYGYSLRVALLSGLSLAQIGEFSFVLVAVGLQNKLLDENQQGLFLALAIGTMLATPFVRFLWPPLAQIMNRSFPNAWSQGYLLGDINENVTPINDHVIVIGFGPNGRHLVDVLHEEKLPYLIIEMNPDTVKKEQAKGRRILYGDAARPEVLAKANIKSAKLVVIAIPDMSAARRVLFLVKDINPEVHTIVRTSYYRELPELKKLGANEVVSQEFETSIQIFSGATP